MKEKGRISNLEEVVTEVLIRLDRLEHGQKELISGQSELMEGQARQEKRMDTLEIQMLELARNQIQLSDRQSDLQNSMIDLIQIVKQNSLDIEDIKSTMSTKEGLNNLFEAMMNRFDKADIRMDSMQEEINQLKSRLH
ncbi:hypothetical protein [Dyadobacter psychrotolerans]|uniref:Uncharacterized protein n=1 Tax=Dyadobacter psychrotolerans TaxID=2541721 RepID=A0A4R5DZP8_9BACT|nr:hypothetical protein [Dyadobacter psychrotolerans]TDE16733.1 hypothetical protein E0F88_10930 [Dyadobacter psychrotolerans]